MRVEVPLLRLIKIVLILLIALPLLAWGGFRLWLANQPDEFRASIEDFSTLEFFDVVYRYAFPSPTPDRASWGRRDYPNRGHSPWVMRSSLDGRPRMISAALGKELWLAYSTETASIHQFWRGKVDYTGPVFDARHGFEPKSQGAAYLRPPSATAWRIQTENGWEAAEIQWLGHGFDPEGALWLRFELRDRQGQPVRIVTEWPELGSPKPDPAASPSDLTLERRFEFSEGPRVALARHDESGPIEIGDGVERRAGRLIFDGRSARILHRFETPPTPARPEGRRSRREEESLRECGLSYLSQRPGARRRSRVERDRAAVRGSQSRDHGRTARYENPRGQLRPLGAPSRCPPIRSWAEPKRSSLHRAFSRPNPQRHLSVS